MLATAWLAKGTPSLPGDDAGAAVRVVAYALVVLDGASGASGAAFGAASGAACWSSLWGS